MGANDTWCEAFLNPRGMIRRIYEKLHITLLNTKYSSFGSCGFRKEAFSCISHNKPKADDNDAP